MNAKGIGVNDHEHPSTILVEPQNASGTAARPFLRAFLLSLGCLCFVVASAFAVHVHRVKQHVRALEHLSASYVWQTQVIDRRNGEGPNEFQLCMARWLGNSLVSNISRVRITNGNPTDEELRFVTGLRQLKAVDIVSDAATDATISALSELPNLRCLSLVGRNFSVMGLLQLRKARTLCQLDIDADRFSPIELAFLRSELPIRSEGQASEAHYKSQPSVMIAPMI